MKSSFPRLLAKSCPDPLHPTGQATLRGHTAAVVAASRRLLQLRARHALAAAGLPETLVERLGAIVRTAAFAHDLGKSSDAFQAMLRGDRTRQLLRHEAATLFIAWPGCPLARWLAQAVPTEDDYRLALIAAAGHHRKFADRAVADADAGAGNAIELLVDHPDFEATLALGAKLLDLPQAPRLERMLVSDSRRSRLTTRFQEWEDAIVSWSAEQELLLAIAKSFVIASDVAGSALARERTGMRWIDTELTRRASGERLSSIVRDRLGDSELRPFQAAVAASKSPWTFVRAGCGTGKTAAAYAWAAAHHSGRQLWFTYPTTGTATEGYRDYIAEADLAGRLIHGRARVDLELFELQDDDPTGQRGHERLQALEAWGAEVVTCTVDTVLGIVQNQRRGQYAWPGLAHAAIVFDEIHAYDDALFGALMRFLRAFPYTPCLLMTASLPSARLGAIRELAQTCHGEPLAEVEGPEDLETLPRYVRSTAQPESLVTDVLSDGGKVLWVTNTVRRALEIGRRAWSVQPILYHSRFRYVDRVQRHAAVVDGFKAGAPAFAVATQVAEMSLDLSADLLITDLAPIPAMIQRLGRLNRRALPSTPAPSVKPFVVNDFSGLPYDEESLEGAKEWLERLGSGGSGGLSQRDLVNAWIDAEREVRTSQSAWLDGRFHTVTAPLREGSPTLTVVLSEDAADVRRRPRLALERALPMGMPPGSYDYRSWKRVAHLPVAPEGSINYDPMRGGQWL